MWWSTPVTNDTRENFNPTMSIGLRSNLAYVAWNAGFSNTMIRGATQRLDGTFNPPVDVLPGNESALTPDRVSGNLYIVMSKIDLTKVVGVARSTNDGVSWQQGGSVPGSEGGSQPSVIANNGTVIVAYNALSLDNLERRFVSISTDAGTTFRSPVPLHVAPTPGDTLDFLPASLNFQGTNIFSVGGTTGASGTSVFGDLLIGDTVQEQKLGNGFAFGNGFGRSNGSEIVGALSNAFPRVFNVLQGKFGAPFIGLDTGINGLEISVAGDDTHMIYALTQNGVPGPIVAGSCGP